MRTKFAALILAGIVLAAGVSSIYAHEQWQQQSDANSEKIAALKEAYRTGLISQQEYDAKMRELNGAGGQQAPSASGGSQTPNVHGDDANGAISRSESADGFRAAAGADGLEFSRRIDAVDFVQSRGDRILSRDESRWIVWSERPSAIRLRVV